MSLDPRERKSAIVVVSLRLGIIVPFVAATAVAGSPTAPPVALAASRGRTPAIEWHASLATARFAGFVLRPGGYQWP